jgi:hypothetical protein
MINVLHANPIKLTKKQRINVLTDSTISKSAKIKVLWESGSTVKQVSEELGIRYNFAYNVISNYVNVGNIDTIKPEKGDTKKSQIVEMFKQGNSLKEISVNLRTNYNYVFNTVKDYKNSLVTEETDEQVSE